MKANSARSVRPSWRTLRALCLLGLGFWGLNHSGRMQAQVGGVDAGFAVGIVPDAAVLTIAVQTDQKVLVAGEFTSLGTAVRTRIARLGADGSVDGAFDPGTGPNSAVRAVAVQPDGKVVIGGAFTQVRGEGRRYVARLQSDGTLDPSFNPGEGPNGEVYAVLVMPDESVLIAGTFSSVAGQPRGYLARLRSNGTLDPAFNAGLNAPVYCLGRTPDGQVLAGGDFTLAGGQLRNRMARFNADGTLDRTLDPAAGPNSTVRTLAVQADGKILIGGAFGDVNGTGRPYLARLDRLGLPDMGFNTAFNNVVYTLVLQPDGKVVAGGEFTSVGGTESPRFVRLRTDGSVDPGFEVGGGANGAVYGMALQLDGNVLLGGNFSQIGGVNRVRLARLQGLSTASGGEIEFSASRYQVSESLASVLIEVRRGGTTSAAVTVDYATSNGTANAGDYTGQSGTLAFAAGETVKTFTIPIRGDANVEDDETVNLALANPGGGAVLGSQRTAVLFLLNDDTSVNPGASDGGFLAGVNGAVWASVMQPDGKVVVVGDFSGFTEGSRLRVARLNRDGTLDASFNPAAFANSTVHAVVVQGDGKIVIGGAFTVVNNVTRNRLARFNADGTLDLSFNPGAGPNSTVYALLVQPNGDLHVGGAFGVYGSESRAYLVRVFPDGNLDPDFNPGFNSTVWALALGSDGKLVAGGDFTAVAGVPRVRVARLNADGSLDASFDPAAGPNSTVRALVLQPDGKLVIGGFFGDINGSGRSYLGRLNSDGLPDPGFAPGFNNVVYSVAVQADGKVLAGGEFSSVNGVEMNRLVRLRQDGSPDPAFAIGTGANGAVLSLTVQTDQEVIVGGNFTTFSGLNRQRLARLRGTSVAPGGELEFQAATFTVSEGQPSRVIEVVRKGATSASVTVDFATSNGTANAADYIGQSGRLTFGIGDKSKTFTVPIRADALLEDDETVVLTLSNPSSGAALGSQRTANLLIANEDSAEGVGGIDIGFLGGASGPIYSLVTQTDGRIIAVGEFAVIGGGSRLRVARLNLDGTLDPTFNPGAWLNSTVQAAVLQEDGRIILGGSFTIANGVVRNRLVRLNTDGTVDPTFNPGAGPNSTVYSLLLEPDGDLLVGGAFGQYNNENRSFLVRVLSDGSLDSTFNAQMNGPVWTLAPAPGGKVVAAGDFTAAFGQPRNRVLRLNVNRTLDPGFDPAAGPNSTVRAAAVGSDGKVVIGGTFGDVNGSGRSYLCRLGVSGLPDPAFLPSLNNAVYSLALQPDGKLLAGGDFTSVNGQEINRLVRFRPDGAVDPSFQTGTGANGFVTALSVELDGNVLVGGNFTQFNGLNRARLIRVQGLTAASGGEIEFSAATYRVSESQPSVTIEVRRGGTTSAAVTVDYATSNGTANAGDYTGQSGKLVFGAGETSKTFTVPIRSDTTVEDDETVQITLTNPGGGAVLGALRTAVLVIANDDNSTAIGGVDTSFGAGVNGTVYTMAVQPDGKVIVAGEFSSFLEASRLRIGRLNADGTLDPTFNPGAWFNSAVHAVALQPDGRIVVGGSFTVVNGYSRNRLARLHSDGTLDVSFDPGIGPNSTVYSLLRQSTGDLVVGGAFSQFNNDSRAYLARVFPDGNLDPGFNPQVNASVWVIVGVGEDRLMAAGDFTSVGGVTRNRVARLNADGTLDTAFNPAGGPNSTVRSLVVQPDGRVVIGGVFGDVNGSGQPYLSRLTAAGLPETGFNAGLNSPVYGLALQADGKIVAGGDFTSAGGLPINRLVRLRADGTVDPAFVVGAGANSTVVALALQPDRNLLIGGNFTQFNGLTRIRLARILAADSAAAPPFEFTSISEISGQIVLDGKSTAGQRYVLQYSRDLGTWFPIATNTAAGATLQFQDPNPTDPHRVYRVVNP